MKKYYFYLFFTMPIATHSEPFDPWEMPGIDYPFKMRNLSDTGWANIYRITDQNARLFSILTHNGTTRIKSFNDGAGWIAVADIISGDADRQSKVYRMFREFDYNNLWYYDFDYLKSSMFYHRVENYSDLNRKIMTAWGNEPLNTYKPTSAAMCDSSQASIVWLGYGNPSAMAQWNTYYGFNRYNPSSGITRLSDGNHNIFTGNFGSTEGTTVCGDGYADYWNHYWIVQNVIGATLSEPTMYFPLEKNPCDIFGDKECASPHGVSYGSDRFGRKEHAAYFSSDGSLAMDIEKISKILESENGATISFWAKVPSTDDERKYPNKIDTNWSYAFWVLVSNPTGGYNIPSALAITEHGYVGISKTTELTPTDKRDWMIWLTEPQKIKHNTDIWRQFVLVMDKGRTTVFTHDPYFDKEQPFKKMYTMHNSIPIKLTGNYSHIGFGSPSLYMQKFNGITAIDDIAIYNKPLTDRQVRDLMNRQLLGDY
ncbi:hypothetical protein NUK55_07810 [Aeromonas veronii]|uniref:hypothetical protein n=1 Tax=Aeromonas veronii TaxID=654 RepID=UPI00214D9D33|nr:hypothetical protein [Aeromonas veronii]MCR3971008.1 hypothetical protein [Aeromonas veronii]MCR3975517.1 hypothetical protein [Aeromonas veronii]